MSLIHIGNDSEFLTIDVCMDPGTVDWVSGDVQIRVRGFTGTITASFEPADFQVFQQELQVLYERLDGTAELRPREGQLMLKLQGNGRGGIDVGGEASFTVRCGSKLDFEFEIDQTFIPGILSQLSLLNTAMHREAR